MWLILFLAFIVALIIYLKLKYFTFRSSVPGLPPQFLFGNLLQTGLLKGTSLPQIYTSLKNRFGDIYQLQFGLVHAFIIGNIDDIQHILNHRHIYDQGDWAVELVGALFPNGLITLKGAKHKRHAAVTIPLFRRAKIISNFDSIIDCTEKLLDNWRTFSNEHIHCDIVQQCQNLLLQIFGLIAFDYDLETINGSNTNEFTQTLRNFTNAVELTAFLPSFILRIYAILSSQYRQDRATAERYLYRMIEHELNETAESRALRKKTSLIASLVDSLQTDEKAEAKKSEEEKKGKI
ncbi:unnamed protein product [Rotaria sp. Silwood2]|nr:unnamed protein product [Rotaria sp. Silwood2]CAF3226623.1 unnamed protein product [Rotaria sp. Silwood2]CAF4190669.1 unnamed protein product [Rotaria sp. Silwood2]